jgi:ferredoxin
MTLKIKLDSEMCQGHGRCYDVAPELFEPDDVGYAKVIRADVPPELVEHARQAERSCPERAITLVEE